MLFATHILEENMKLYEIFEMMKAKYFDTIVFIKSGKFYVVYDNDAIICNYLLHYKKVNGKVGFPENALSHVLEILNQKEVSYVIFEDHEKLFENNQYFQILKKANENQVVENMCYQLENMMKEKLLEDMENFSKIRSFLSEL